MAERQDKTKILLVDDDEEDFLIIRNTLHKIPGAPFRIDWVADIDEAIELIEAAKHDVYLVDYRLGPNSGFEILRQFDLLDRREPFIILTGAGDEQIEREAMQLGAADYLVKGSFDAELLSRVLRYSQQRKAMEAQRIHQLMAINKSKDEFIALASHQLRTPATVVKQYLRMVLDGYAGPISPEQQLFLDNAYISNERQIRIVDDILRVAQLDLDKVTLHLTKVDVGKLLAGIVEELQSYTAERSQMVQFEKPKKPVEVYADEKYLRMAVGNILDNASKYTPDHKAIYVSVAQEDAQVVVAVRDEGVGISKQDLPKLFMKFSRVNNPLSIKVGGTGLGLYWAKEVIQLHGGSVSVTSKLGTGTTFTIRLRAE